MKPIIKLIVAIETINTEKKQKSKVTATLQAKLPTNAVPRKGEKLSIYIWEDDSEKSAKPSIVEVEEVYHSLVNGKWEQSVTVRETMIDPDTVPDDGTSKELMDLAICWLDEVVARLESQGFKRIVTPNKDGIIHPM